MSSSMAHKGFIGVAILLAGFYAFMGVGTLVGMQDYYEVARYTGLIPLAFASTVAAGLLFHLRWRLPGQIVMMVGAFPPAVMYLWTIVTPLLAVLMVALWLCSRRQA